MSSEKCWKQRGTDGDRSCTALEHVQHCRNCPDFLAAGRRLFDRPLPRDYVLEQTRHFMQEKAVAQAYTCAIVVFRVGAEWFGLATSVVHEVLAWTPARAVPHRSNTIFCGLINANGELLPCCAARPLLGLADTDSAGDGSGRRLLILSSENERYALAVDELHSVLRVHEHSVQPAPATVLRSPACFTDAVLEQEGRQIGVLNCKRLFEAMQQSLTGS